MSRVVLSLTLLLLFFLESTVLPFFSPSSWGLSFLTVPRFALVGTIFVALFIGRREGLLYGMILGLLHDVMYGKVIGVFALSMMVASYFSGLVFLLFHRSIAVVASTVILVLFGHEWLLYSLFRLFYTSPVDVQWVLTKRILPSVALNFVFALLVYLPFSKLCTAVKENKETQGE
ncbi:rod shape-determining protein MreD [Brevibacillus dissolubilis]|uniref:rod shape-determining protein MreD n=1 Tax=Brevibacillus dissolubilis TaxID=1844116 RepID=UPI001115B5F6|nr:rod shape-determining protein MreD [Brevibacillus dissolubilis]